MYAIRSYYDDCGNTTSQTQTIDVVDTTPPVLAGVPASITVECDAVPDVSTATVTATDNCSEPTITYLEVRTDGPCDDTYTLTRTWTSYNFV